MSKYSMLYNDGKNNYQSDFYTVYECEAFCNEEKSVKWAVVVEIETGKIVFNYNETKKFKIPSTNETIKHLTLEHYKRMIAWATTQPFKKEVDDEEMRYTIGEWWHASDCPYCDKYDDTIHCPLNTLESYYCGKTCCNNLWRKMSDSQTWGEWIKNAIKVVEFIEEHG